MKFKHSVQLRAIKGRKVVRILKIESDGIKILENMPEALILDYL